MRRAARINVRAVVVLALIAVVLGGGLYAVHRLRLAALERQSLDDGLAAYENGDWAAACKALSRYLEKDPENADILRMYARAQLNRRPLEEGNLSAAIDAYRQVLVIAPRDRTAYLELTKLYLGTRNLGEMVHVAGRWREALPDDPAAGLWMAQSRLEQGQTRDARTELLRLVQDLEPRPEKQSEFVDACLLLSRLEWMQSGLAGADTAITWLDRALAYDPNAPEPLLLRARARRLQAAATSGAARQKLWATARGDLERADALQPKNARLRLVLGAEWLALGDLAQARQEIVLADELPADVIAEGFPVREDWKVARFVQLSAVLLEQPDGAESVRLAEQTLGELQTERDRQRVLPGAISLYLHGQRVTDARRCLDEYLAHESRDEDAARRREETVLSALVAEGEGHPYQVLELLGPLNDPSPPPAVWRLLARAYEQTGQSARAIGNWTRYVEAVPDDAATRRQLAELYRRTGQWGAALEQARVLAAAQPNDFDAEMLLLECRFRTASRVADLDPIAQRLTELAQANPRRVEIPLLQAGLALAQQKPADAERVLQQAIQMCDEPLAAELRLVQLYATTDRLDEARTASAAASTRHPDVPDVWQARANVELAAGNNKAAQDALRAGLDKIQDAGLREPLERRLALLEIQAGDVDGGVQRLQQLADADPGNVAVRDLLLRVPQVANDAARSQKLLDELKSIEGGDAGVWWRLHAARLALAASDWRTREQETRTHLNACLAADSSWEEPVLLLGSLCERLGDLDGAETVYRRWVEGTRAATAVIDRLVALLERQGRLTEAQQLLSRLNLTPAQESAYELRASVAGGDYDRAIELLKVRAATDPHDAAARIDLAQLLHRQGGDVDRALAYLDEARAIAGESQLMARLRIALLRDAGRLDALRAYVDERVAQDDSFETHALRAEAWASIGDVAGAEREYRALCSGPDGARGFVLLGVFYADAGRLDDALAAWQEGLGQYDDATLRRLLVDGLIERNTADDRAAAGRLLDQLEAGAPDDWSLKLARARLLMNSGDPAGARGLLVAITESEPRAVAAQRLLIQLALADGHLNEARDRVLRALGTNVDDPDLWLARAQVELARGDWDAAGDAARHAIRLHVASADAILIDVEASLRGAQAAELTEALGLVDDALHRTPDVAALHVARARVLAALGRSDEAREGLEAFCARMGAQAQGAAWLMLAELHADRGETEAVARCIATASASDPQTPTLLVNLLTRLSGQGRLATVVQLTQGELPNPPFTLDVLMTAAAVLAPGDVAGQRAHAVELAQRALTLVPAGSPVRLDVAGLLYQAGAVDVAEKIYRDALAADPQNTRILNDLAWIVQEAHGDYDAALQLADAGLAINPNEPHLLDTRGVILQKLPGRLAAARADFERRLQILQATAPGTATYAQALLQLARVCVKLDDRSTAQTCLKDALAIDREQRAFSDMERAEIARLLD